MFTSPLVLLPYLLPIIFLKVSVFVSLQVNILVNRKRWLNQAKLSHTKCHMKPRLVQVQMQATDFWLQNYIVPVSWFC